MVNAFSRGVAPCCEPVAPSGLFRMPRFARIVIKWIPACAGMTIIVEGIKGLIGLCACAEVDDVAVFDRVIRAFYAYPSRRFCFCFSAAFGIIAPRTNFGADELVGKVAVYRTRRLPCRTILFYRPCPRFLLPRRKKGYQSHHQKRRPR